MEIQNMKVQLANIWINEYVIEEIFFINRLFHPKSINNIFRIDKLNLPLM